MVEQIVGILDMVTGIHAIMPLTTWKFPHNIKVFHRGDITFKFSKRSKSGRLIYEVHRRPAIRKLDKSKLHI